MKYPKIFFRTGIGDYRPLLNLSERRAIAEYEGMLEKLCEGEIAALIRRIILDEEAHLHAFKRMYRDLTER